MRKRPIPPRRPEFSCSKHSSSQCPYLKSLELKMELESLSDRSLSSIKSSQQRSQHSRVLLQDGKKSMDHLSGGYTGSVHSDVHGCNHLVLMRLNGHGDRTQTKFEFLVRDGKTIGAHAANDLA